MRKILTLILLTIIISNCQAQVNLNPEQKDTIFYNDTIPEDVRIVTETPPEFPGGEVAIISYIKQHVHYPKSAIKDSIEGKVTLRFVIDGKGVADNIVFLKSIHPEIETECIQMLREMPKWKPGTQLTKSKKGWYWSPVKIWFLVSLNFTLTNDKNLKGITITP
jgi:TonB family protein